MTKILKTCNCCLDRNKVPVLMGSRANIRWCKRCKMTTVWEHADPAIVLRVQEQRAAMSALIEQLLSEIDKGE